MADRPARPYRIEACVVDAGQAVSAERNGADRVELCRDLHTGGLTPDFGIVLDACTRISIPVRLMIRCTASGFEGTSVVIQQMTDEIRRFNTLPVEGYVFGVMREGRIDVESMARLIDAADGRPCTLHKAIDESIDPEADIDLLNHLEGLDTVLTSGGAQIALDGIEGIRRIRDRFRGEVMAAGRVTPEMLPALHAALRLPWYHGRAITGPVGTT
jgi:copper homeostasis protein